MLMITPASRARITGSTNRQHSSVPNRFVVTSDHQTRGSISQIGPTDRKLPALLNNTSMRPYRSAITSIVRRTAASSVTSTG
jgi:hypothetical protein